MTDVITVDGQLFRRQYLLYVLAVDNEVDRFYYVGQTGDRRYITARPPFRRLAAHFEDSGSSTQNQIYRHVASNSLGFPEGRTREGAFSESLKQAVEDFLVESSIRMHVYGLEPFRPGIDREEHLEIVRRVTAFEGFVVSAFLRNGRRLANTTIPRRTRKPPPYPEVFARITAGFGLEE